MLFLWFYHAARRNSPRFVMVSDHINYLTFEDPGAVHTVRRALKLAHAGDLYGAAETAGVDVAHAAVVGEGLRRGMRFSIGAEVDNDPRARPDAQNIVDAMRPDGIIRSVHFITIDHPEKGADFAWPYDNPEFISLFDHIGVDRVWELYTERLFEDIEKLPGHVVGHFYKPAIFGHWPSDKTLEAYEDRLLELARARGMAIEINTRQLYRADEPQREKYVAANKRLMRKAKAKGVGIAIGSDAHSPKDQGGGFDALLHMLDESGINEIVFPVAGRLARVVLRATREHLEAHRTPEPVQPGSSITGFSRAELGLPEMPDVPKVPKVAKALRDVGPKKRTSAPTRETKKATADEAAPKSSSKRSAESAASSAKAKESKSATKPTAKPPAKKAEPAPKKPVAVKAIPLKKVAAPAKKAVAPVKKVAAPVKKAAAAPVKKTASVPAKKVAAPAKKAAVAVAKKPVVAVKKKTVAPVKKAAAPVKKVAPVKKAAAPAKKAAAPLKKAAPVKKAVAPAKKVSKPSNKGTTTKKTPKRR
jgi:HisJ family histidinol phosphate phosphatase